MTAFTVPGPADAEVLARVATGDEAALELLHARYGGVVFGFVSARMADRSSAEEVAADVWLGCWRSAGAFRGDSQVLTWLLGIAKRQVGSHTRRKHVPQVPFDVDRHDVTAADLDPAELVASVQDTATVVAALRTLPPELAEVVRLAVTIPARCQDRPSPRRPGVWDLPVLVKACTLPAATATTSRQRSTSHSPAAPSPAARTVPSDRSTTE